MKNNKKLEIESFQHLSFEVTNEGKVVPMLGNAVYINQSCSPTYEGKMSFERALEQVIETRTLSEDAIRPDDRKELRAYLQSLTTLIQAARLKVEALPHFDDSPVKKINKKRKP